MLCDTPTESQFQGGHCLHTALYDDMLITKTPPFKINELMQNKSLVKAIFNIPLKQCELLDTIC